MCLARLEPCGRSASRHAGGDRERGADEGWCAVHDGGNGPERGPMGMLEEEACEGCASRNGWKQGTEMLGALLTSDAQESRMSGCSSIRRVLPIGWAWREFCRRRQWLSSHYVVVLFFSNILQNLTIFSDMTIFSEEPIPISEALFPDNGLV